jgi:hypothetical protein
LEENLVIEAQTSEEIPPELNAQIEAESLAIVE